MMFDLNMFQMVIHPPILVRLPQHWAFATRRLQVSGFPTQNAVFFMGTFSGTLPPSYPPQVYMEPKNDGFQ